MATGYTVRASGFDADKAARFGGGWWVECPHTATGDALVEQFCPHFATERDAEDWVMARPRSVLERVRGLIALHDAGARSVENEDDLLRAIESAIQAQRRYFEVSARAEGGAR